MIPYGRQDIDPSDIEAVVKVLKSDFLTQGPMVPAFERAIAARVNAPHAVCVSNATAGLHIAMLALGVGAKSLVWTTPNTFVATANTALLCGADIDFVDIDPKSYCLSADRLEEKLESTQRAGGRLPDLVVPVHFAGQSCDMPRLAALANRYGFSIIEDASHAIGADADGGPVGDCRYSAACVFSFHPVKIITTGEGGAITTRDSALAQRMADLRSHGITRDVKRMSSAAQTSDVMGPWYYELQDVGLNYRLTDLQAALGLSQIAKLDQFVARRRVLAARYDEILADLPLTTPWQHHAGQSSYHLYPIVIDTDTVGKTRRQIFDTLRSSDIGVNVHYIPVHLQPVYRARGFSDGYCPAAEAYYARAITIPLFSAMTDEEQNTIVAALRAVLQ